HRRAAPAAGEEVGPCTERSAAHVASHLTRQVEQVVIHQKKTAESMVLDECQFLREPSHRLVTLLGTLRIARFEHRPTQLGDRLRGGAPIRPAEVREPVAQVPGDAERPAAAPPRPRVGDSTWTGPTQRSARY